MKSAAGGDVGASPPAAMRATYMPKTDMHEWVINMHILPIYSSIYIYKYIGSTPNPISSMHLSIYLYTDMF